MSERMEMTAIITARPGREDELSARVRDLVTATQAEPGVVEFRVFRDLETPGRFVLWEIFEDAEALRAHMEEEHTRAYFALDLAERTQVIRQRLL